MWRKDAFFQFLLSSLLLAGAAEARQAGAAGAGLWTGDSGWALPGGRTPAAEATLASYRTEGDAGSIINPDGVRVLGTSPAVAGDERSGWVRLAVDPHG